MFWGGLCQSESGVKRTKPQDGPRPLARRPGCANPTCPWAPSSRFISQANGVCCNREGLDVSFLRLGPEIVDSSGSKTAQSLAKTLTKSWGLRPHLFLRFSRGSAPFLTQTNRRFLAQVLNMRRQDPLGKRGGLAKATKQIYFQFRPGPQALSQIGRK